MVGLLNRLGLQVGNDGQRPGKTGLVSWLHIFEDEYKLPWVGGELHGRKFKTVWHQVRNPLKSLTSIGFTEPLFQADYESYLQRHVTLTNASGMVFTKKPSPSNRQAAANIFRALEFYLQWHEFIDSLHVPMFRLENILEDANVTVIDSIFESIGQKPPDHNTTLYYLQENQRRRRRRRLVQAKINMNQRKHREMLQWQELCEVHEGMTRRVVELTQTYGYYREVKLDVCEQYFAQSSNDTVRF